MKIHLLRHADAEDFATSDSARVLTSKGKEQAAQVASFLQRTRHTFDLILTSPYLRALQTAQAVAAAFSTAILKEDRRLGSGMLVQTGFAVIQENSEIQDLLIVGHEPDLGNLAAFLLTKDRSLSIDFGKASFLTMHLFQPQPGTGVLESFLRVEQMAAIG